MKNNYIILFLSILSCFSISCKLQAEKLEGYITIINGTANPLTFDHQYIGAEGRPLMRLTRRPHTIKTNKYLVLAALSKNPDMLTFRNSSKVPITLNHPFKLGHSYTINEKNNLWTTTKTGPIDVTEIDGSKRSRAEKTFPRLMKRQSLP